MALFGLFGKKADSPPHRKHAERVANKRAQAADRWESIQALAQAARGGDSAAVAALLPRFTFYVDPSITDQDEKDAAFHAVVDVGADAVAPVVAFMRKAESIAWPLKILASVESEAEVVGHLLELLAPMDVEYERDPQRKIDIIAALEARADERVVPALTRFLQDANETVRFNAVGATLAQAQAGDALVELVDCAAADESVRVRNRVLEGLVGLGTAIPEDQRSKLSQALTPGYRLGKAGLVTKA